MTLKGTREERRAARAAMTPEERRAYRRAILNKIGSCNAEAKTALSKLDTVIKNRPKF